MKAVTIQAAQHTKPLMTAALALALFGPVAGAQTLVPFSDPKLPFSFSHPAGWLGVDLGDKTSGVSMVSGKAPPATMIRLLFVPKVGQKSLTTAQQLDDFEKGLSSTGVTIKRQSNYAASYGGLKGTERELLISQGKKTIKMRVWFGEGRKNIYSFQLSDSPERYAAASALYSKVLGTLKFK